MKELSEYGLYAVIWACFTIMFCLFVGSILYYNIEKPSHNEVMIKLGGIGYSPAIIRCAVKSNWNNPLEYEICKKILVNNNLTLEEAEDLIRRLENGGVD